MIADDFKAIRERSAELDATGRPAMTKPEVAVPAFVPSWHEIPATAPPPPFGKGPPIRLNPFDVSAFVRSLRDLTRELAASPELRAHVDGKLREGVRDWANVPLIKHPDGSYTIAEPEPPAAPPDPVVRIENPDNPDLYVLVRRPR